ncbi:MAG TPA: hypothetical protein VFV38_08455 [Ktedonobacteraceae bacterium]|nr:hypothetical protein [Ktedonobacteraceae bacterium]
MEQAASPSPLTNRLIEQACKMFQESCYAHPPLLKDLYDRAVKIAKQVSETLSSEQVLLLLQERPEWIQARARVPGTDPVAAIVADQLACLLRHTLNECWAALLLQQEGCLANQANQHS